MSPISIDDYQVEIFEYPFSNYLEIDSADKYDLVYLENSRYHLSTVIGVKIHNHIGLLKSALIGAEGGATGIHPTSFIIESDRIIVCCSDTIFCLSIPELNLIWKTKADDATCFEIFKYKSDYIVHGELEITRLSYSGHIIWQQNGADIFTTVNSPERAFMITPEYILATDWEGKKYKFDFHGNPVE